MSLAAGSQRRRFRSTIRADQSRAVSRGAIRVCQLEACDSGHSGMQHLRDLIAGLLGFHIAYYTDQCSSTMASARPGSASFFFRSKRAILGGPTAWLNNSGGPPASALHLGIKWCDKVSSASRRTPFAASRLSGQRLAGVCGISVIEEMRPQRRIVRAMLLVFVSCSTPLCIVHYNTKFYRECGRLRSSAVTWTGYVRHHVHADWKRGRGGETFRRFLPDRKSTRLNSSHLGISYA